MSNDNIRKELRPYLPVLHMLAETFGSDAEIILHDLRQPEHSVVDVVNASDVSVTGRKVGESFDHLVKQGLLTGEAKTEQKDYVANYYFTARNNKKIRSSSVILRKDAGEVEGAICINIDTTRLMRQIEYLQSFLPQPPDAPEEEETAPVQDMVTSLIERIIGAADPAAMSREEKIAKIRFMEEKGIFLMKGSIEAVANRLGVTKVTVYSYLDEVRGKR